MEDLEVGLLEYKIVEEFLTEIKKESREGDKETVKVAELKRLEQGGKMMKEFVQKFRRVARRSGYKGKLLIKEFKREINRTIYQRSMESEWQPISIEQWYNRAIVLDRNWKESKREEKRLRG